MRQQRLFGNDLLILLPEALILFKYLSHVGLIFSMNSVFKTSSDMSWGLIQIKLRKLGIEHTYFMSVAKNKTFLGTIFWSNSNNS